MASRPSRNDVDWPEFRIKSVNRKFEKVGKFMRKYIPLRILINKLQFLTLLIQRIKKKNS